MAGIVAQRWRGEHGELARLFLRKLEEADRKIV